jgi:hypothetical protein
MKDEFFELITDAVGKISSRRFTKQYFESRGKSDLWNWFEQQLQIFEGYSHRDTALCLKSGLSEPPKCIVCGKKSKIQSYRSEITFDYCSKDCSHKSDKRKNKISQTKLDYSDEKKYSIEEKRKQTNLQKYGVEYQSQRPEVSEIISSKLSAAQMDPDIKLLLTDFEWMNREYIINKRSAFDIADELDIFYGTVIDHLRKFGFKIRRGGYSDSVPQKQIYEFIKSFYNGEILYNDWSMLVNKEIDIYMPDLKFGIEHNGLPSHSSNKDIKKNENRHLEKTLLCEELGIDLFHIRGDQWQSKREIVKSMIRHKMGFSERKIYARKCKIKELENVISFLDENHIQGSVETKNQIKYGLFFENELVSVMTFCTPRFGHKIAQWELLRFANKLNTNVVGGFSKLLKHFRKNYKGSIISYCDRSRSNGKVYISNGFRLTSKRLNPVMSWTNWHKVWHRLYSTKSNIKKRFESGKEKYFDSSLDQNENMYSNGYYKIYDCGQMTFLLE